MAEMDFALSFPRIVFGPGSVSRLRQELAALGIRRPLLVSDPGLVGLGHVDRVADLLGPDCTIFANTPENPTSAGVMAAVASYREGHCDALVALGGGSVIDTAKLAAVIAGQGGEPDSYLGHPDRVQKEARPLVVVPTTAGTGSDSSPDAGIHPDAASISSGITSRFAVPRLAVCDPELTLSLPAGLTAATGLDAISHCVEGYLAKGDSPLADTLALDGLARAWRWVEAATAEGSNIEARSQMMLAAWEGGIAIAKGLGPAHAIAISCGDQGLHHGRLSALGMLAMLDLMRDRLPERVAALKRAAGLPPSADFGAALKALMLRLSMPVTLAEAGYRIGRIDALAETCAASHFNLTAGYRPSAMEYRMMLGTISGQ